MLEQIAERYLNRRGRVVLPRAFIGLAIGYGEAFKLGEGMWNVTFPKYAPVTLIAINNSHILDQIK